MRTESGIRNLLGFSEPEKEYHGMTAQRCDKHLRFSAGMNKNKTTI